ncbi:MAG TPA: hypothetical protein VMS30_04935 [Phycisphaerales bacterium]|nr:hypothetical protein [Phycisphaerales bacterium]
MLLLATRVLLAVLLTMSSPAWCACVFAAEWTPAASGFDGCGDSCCPPAEVRATGDDLSNQGDRHPDQGLPCRDQSDCSCCDAASALTAPLMKEAGVPKALLRADLAPMPAVLTWSYATAQQGTPRRGLESRGAPPPLTAAAPLLLRGCLLLT